MTAVFHNKSNSITDWLVIGQSGHRNFDAKPRAYEFANGCLRPEAAVRATLLIPRGFDQRPVWIDLSIVTSLRRTTTYYVVNEHLVEIHLVVASFHTRRVIKRQYAGDLSASYFHTNSCFLLRRILSDETL